jgi:hypothetical protein
MSISWVVEAGERTIGQALREIYKIKLDTVKFTKNSVRHHGIESGRRSTVAAVPERDMLATIK